MAKKSNIRQRGRSWVVYFRRDGKQIWKSFKTKEAADLFLAQAMVRKAQEQPEPASRSIKLAAFADEWLTDHRVHVGEQTFVNSSPCCAFTSSQRSGISN